MHWSSLSTVDQTVPTIVFVTIHCSNCCTIISDRSVSVVTRLWAPRQEVLLPAGAGNIFVFVTVSRPAPGPNQPLIEWVRRSLPTGVKRSGPEANH
jgi:hypothetical protein